MAVGACHELILMPASLMTLDQRASRRGPACRTPPAYRPRIDAELGKRFANLVGLERLVDGLIERSDAGGVPGFNIRPFQSSAAAWDTGLDDGRNVLERRARLWPITASARSLPVLICCTTGSRAMN